MSSTPGASRPQRELRRRSRELFPTASRHLRAQWVLKRLRADRLPPHYASLLPLTQPAAELCVFAPRTLAEAGWR